MASLPLYDETENVALERPRLDLSYRAAKQRLAPPHIEQQTESGWGHVVDLALAKHFPDTQPVTSRKKGFSVFEIVLRSSRGAEIWDPTTVLELSEARDLSSDWAKAKERIVLELGRLREGWDGPGSIAPNDKLVKDVDLALQSLPPHTVEPELEVDSSDGSATIRWEANDRTRSVVFNFHGTGRVLIACAERGHPAKVIGCAANEETRILDFLDRCGMKDLLTA